MRIELGSVACAGIDTHLGGDAEAAVRMALLHYVDKANAGHAAIELPEFCRDPGPTEKTLEVTVAPDCLVLLENDAARQGVAAARLAAHAVLIFLAELDRQLEVRTAL